MEVRGPFGPDGSDGVGPPTMPSEFTPRTAPHWPPIITGPAPATIPVRKPRRWLRRIGFTLLTLAALFFAQIVVYRFDMPAWTPTMAVSHLMGEPVIQSWVPLSRVSPLLIRAVIASEDARFCKHQGIDFGELKAAIEDARGGSSPRGASTITMQVVKNVFLWPGRSYVRKAMELPLALVVDFVWPKRRIMEVYLNIAEWGPGIYGIEAASRDAFAKPARALTSREAARLAVVLPDPTGRDPARLEPRRARVAQIVGARMRGNINVSCIN
ncbi:MAG: monofunctional biosynthetic peptidoglycan transglycosylase [Hyphomicrobiaceae bacterium]